MRSVEAISSACGEFESDVCNNACTLHPDKGDVCNNACTLHPDEGDVCNIACTLHPDINMSICTLH